MEIERKYLIEELPKGYQEFPHVNIEQGYLSTEPVVRIRRSDDDYFKDKKFMENRVITKESYEHLRTKIDGILIHKIRYQIPFEAYTIELDVFLDDLAPLCLAEVEFDTMEQAENFIPPSWFKEDVTFAGKYNNSNLSRGKV